MDNRPSTKLDFASDIDFSRILTNPILDIAARFWEDDRYEAFKICYRSMRVIDDLVDDRKSLNEQLTETEKSDLETSLRYWLQALEEEKPQDSFQETLLGTIREFHIPKWPWARLCKAMIFDIHHSSFPTFLSFVRYAEGAAIAPASIFMHLCGIEKNGPSTEPPPYDIRLAARPLALFSYLVHIMRDFEKDQKAGLNYFADNLCRQHKISIDRLAQITASHSPSAEFRSLMHQYFQIAEYYRQLAERIVERHLIFLTPRYRLSLGMIYSLYLQIFERIDPENGNFSTGELNPTPEEIQERIDQTISYFAALS